VAGELCSSASLSLSLSLSPSPFLLSHGRRVCLTGAEQRVAGSGRHRGGQHAAALAGGARARGGVGASSRCRHGRAALAPFLRALVLLFPQRSSCSHLLRSSYSHTPAVSRPPELPYGIQIPRLGIIWMPFPPNQRRDTQSGRHTGSS
jgi:hypothetical protein